MAVQLLEGLYPATVLEFLELMHWYLSRPAPGHVVRNGNTVGGALPGLALKSVSRV
jgi:hypothetical protein